ncbi:RNA polymerase sigma factor [Granulicella cerasi]|uniref:RNA polymerase sigma factor n=1 Tax=Granulicella cerasi TaxID=741063 RepID=A0ABW1ZDP2_9BACT|nr:sigma-70 family RNA polymerase sigma factor [Granulicella cerasi]
MQAADTERRFHDQVGSHRGILFKVCNLYGTSHEDREDLAQEILIQLWRSFGAFDGRCAFSTWMYRVALNTAISWLRHDTFRRQHIEPAEEHLLIALPAREADSDKLRLLYDLIEDLDPMQKAMVMLYLDGNSHQEIGEVLGTTASNVSTRMNRIKNEWKQKIGHRPSQEKNHDNL